MLGTETMPCTPPVGPPSDDVVVVPSTVPVGVGTGVGVADGVAVGVGVGVAAGVGVGVGLAAGVGDGVDWVAAHVPLSTKSPCVEVPDTLVANAQSSVAPAGE